MYNVSPFPTLFAQPFSNTNRGQFGTNTPPAPPRQEAPPELALPRYVNYLADYSGCGHWRIIWPEQIINATGKGCSSSLTGMVLDPRWYQNLTCVKVQRQASNTQKEFMKFLLDAKKTYNFKIIYEVDDVVFREDIPDYNRFKFAFDTDEIRQNCIDIINMCDEVTVTCEFMKNLYQERTGKKEITVLPNFVPFTWMGYLYNKRRVWDDYERNVKRPRILYTGSGAHYDVDNKVGGKDDFEQVVKLVVDTRHKYKWVFVGSFPPHLLPYVQNGDIEFHQWQSLIDYPKFIAGLQAQLMIAPLQDNNFNKSKSDIKFIEAALLGIPCLCQDLVTYSTAPPDLRFKTTEELKNKIDIILNYKNRKQYKANIEQLNAMGATRTLENPENIGCHLEALNTPYGSPNRPFLSRWNK